MATKVLGKMNSKLKFLYRILRYLENPRPRSLSNGLTQPRFDYACSSWYPGSNKRLSKNSVSTKQLYLVFSESKTHSTYSGHRIQSYELAANKEQGRSMRLCHNCDFAQRICFSVRIEQQEGQSSN